MDNDKTKDPTFATEVELDTGGTLTVLPLEETAWLIVRDDSLCRKGTWNMQEVWGVKYNAEMDETLVYLPDNVHLPLRGDHVDMLTDWLVWLS
jgi:hypothetical protein